MRTKINDRLRRILSKHFVKSLFAKVAVPIKADRHAVTSYWKSCPQNLKHTSLCFFSKELIELVNNTNTKLLYANFLIKTNKARSSVLSEDSNYNLLNAFELLWNVDGQQAEDCERIAESNVDELNLVEILSHEPKSSKLVESKDEKAVIGRALIVKMECLDVVLDICEVIRPKSFIQYAKDDSPMLCEGDSGGELILIPDETMLIKAIDQKQITSWNEFEYVLTVIVENRLLRLYQAHLDQQYRTVSAKDLEALFPKQKILKEKKKKRKRNSKKANDKKRDSSA